VKNQPHELWEKEPAGAKRANICKNIPRLSAASVAFFEPMQLEPGLRLSSRSQSN
jgi:hypothetical protein